MEKVAESAILEIPHDMDEIYACARALNTSLA